MLVLPREYGSWVGVTDLLLIILKSNFKSFHVLNLLVCCALFIGPYSTALQKAPTSLQVPQCRAELAQTGYSVSKQNEFCLALNEPQWNCSRVILKKYHSLELAKDVCLTATVTETLCFVQVMNRNYDPYVAKRVCGLSRGLPLQR